MNDIPELEVVTRGGTDRVHHRHQWNGHVYGLADGGQLVVWGTADQRQNQERMSAATLPCVISCDWSEAEHWARQNHGDTHWVQPDLPLTIL